MVQRFRSTCRQPNTVPSWKRLVSLRNISIGRNFELSILCFVDFIDECVDDMVEILAKSVVVLSHCIAEHHNFVLKLPDFVVA